MDRMTIDDLFLALPKTELHVHLEGCLEPELYLALARRNGTKTRYASVEELRQRLRDAVDLPSFIEIYEELLAVMKTEDDFRDAALDYCARVAAQNVVYVEMFFDPQLHVERGVKLSTVFDALDSARREAKTRFGLELRYIMCFNRDRPAESAMAILEESRAWRDRFIGIGLDNPEEEDFPHKFEPLYRRAAELGLRLTSHCDVGQPKTVAHHWGCLDLLRVERIDHGLNVLDDPKLVEAIQERRIGLTACPTLFHSHQPGRMAYRAGAVRRMLELGLRVSVNSDDPGLKRSGYLGDVFRLMQEEAQLAPEQVVQLVRNGFEMAWMTEQERTAYLQQLDATARKLGVT